MFYWNHPYIDTDSSFLSGCRYLKSLSLHCVVLDWTNWRPPAAVETLSLVYLPFSPDGPIPLPGPDPEMGEGAPRIDQLITIVNTPFHLTSLTLWGCFPERVDYELEHRQSAIFLPELRTLSIGGEGSAVDFFCRSLITPQLSVLTVSSNKWSRIPSIKSLTDQIRFDSPHSYIIPFVNVGGVPDLCSGDTIVIDFVEQPAAALRARLEVRDLVRRTGNRWIDVFTRPRFPRVVGLAVVDNLASYDGPHPTPPSIRDWWLVAEAYPRIARIRMWRGLVWSTTMVEALTASEYIIWPDFSRLMFTLPLDAQDKEKIALGDWIQTLAHSNRSFPISLNGQDLSFTVLHDFITTLPSTEINRHFTWLTPPTP